ncbi:MAG: sigma-54-dependent Fis family transcriptional regulator, partial [Thermoguttaceae bacterium]|nr:sigma-54-dependent Fis family transcriptional regulator [Thermoguttaceae bacterium]
YDWPGNIRQLRNATESMVVVDFDGLLDVDDLPEDILAVFPPDSGADVTPGAPVVPPPAPAAAAADGGSAAWLVGRTMDEIELTAISETLKACGGNREATAKMLGIGERTLYRKLKEIEKK